MHIALAWVAAAVITILEVWVGTWEGRADLQSTHCRTNKYSKIAAAWAGSFELILIFDIWIVQREGWAIGFPIVAAAIWSKYHALERRRRKWRARVKQRKGP